MLKLTKTLSLVGLIAVALFVTGCLISGTFVLWEGISFEFTAVDGSYHHSVDLTSNSIWDDHKDNIHFIDAVGLEFTVINENEQDVTMNIYAAPYETVLITDPAVFKIIDDFVVPASDTTSVSYAESLAFIKNISALKALVLSGKFDYFGTTTNNSGALFKFDGKIIVTISGGV